MSQTKDQVLNLKREFELACPTCLYWPCKCPGGGEASDDSSEGKQGNASVSVSSKVTSSLAYIPSPLPSIWYEDEAGKKGKAGPSIQNDQEDGYRVDESISPGMSPIPEGN